MQRLAARRRPARTTWPRSRRRSSAAARRGSRAASRAQLLGQVALVEPDRRRPGRTRRAPPPRRSRGCAAASAAPAPARPCSTTVASSPGRDLGQAAGRAVVLVPERRVLEQVVDGHDRARPQLGERRPRAPVASVAGSARCDGMRGRAGPREAVAGAAPPANPRINAPPAPAGRACPGPPCVPTTAPSSHTRSIAGLRAAPAHGRPAARPRSASRVGEPDPRPCSGRARVGAQEAVELAQRPAPPADHAPVERQLAVAQRQQRPQAERVARQLRRAADAAAAAQVLERVDVDHDLTRARARPPPTP